jgi:hypothetical protein
VSPFVSVISENGLSVSNITDNSVTVSWPQVIGAVKYNVNVGVAQSFGGGGFNGGHVLSDLYSQVDARTTTYTVTGLTGLSGMPNTSYVIEVDAVNASGNVPLLGTGPSADINISGEFNPPTTPVWPNGSTVTASDITATGASLTWTPGWNIAYDFGSNAGVRYAVYNGDNLIGTTGNNSFDVPDLSPNNSYHFYVKASYGEIWADGPSISIATASSSSAPAQTPLTGIGATTGTTQVGDNLAAGTVTPTGATVTYQWQECDKSNGTYTIISNATASTYTLTSTDLNMYLDVVVTGTNGYTGSETSPPVGHVTAASAPQWRWWWRRRSIALPRTVGYKHHRFGSGCPGVRRDNLTGQ